jgi:hypothetical protein
MLYQNGVRITTNTSSAYKPLLPTEISGGITAGFALSSSGVLSLWHCSALVNIVILQ